MYSIETVMYKVPHADLNVILYCHDRLASSAAVWDIYHLFIYILILTNIILKECRCCVHLCIRVYPFVSLLMCNGIEYIYTTLREHFAFLAACCYRFQLAAHIYREGKSSMFNK